jgi:hypothetical protein
MRIYLILHLSLLAFLFQPGFAWGQCCSYTLMMQDSYGDGWNGGYLEIFRNDTSLGFFSGSGYGSAAEIAVCDGDSLRFVYASGMYENENTYQLYSPGWQLLLEGGPDIPVGEVHRFETHCDTINLQANHPCTAIPIDTVDCVVADNSLHPGSGINAYCAEFQGGDMWFVLQVPPSGNLSIQTDSGGLTDTGMAAWIGSSCTGLRWIGCDDDAGTDAYSFLSFYELDPSQQLYIQVFGYAGARGSFRLCAKDLGFVTIDSSELPIISIYTNGQSIPNDPKIDAVMQIRYNGPGAITHVTDSPNVYDGHIGIEVRGASSSGYPQIPYSLETRDEAGVDLDVALLGMPEESDWVLISNFNDRSLVRNTLSYKLFTAMGQYSPKMEMCEVLLDSIYKGIYLFGEKIKRDKNRVNIANLKPEDIEGDDITGGYILQQNYWNAETSFQSNFSPIDHPEFDVHFVYEFPKPEDITEVQKTYIASYVDSLETALYSNDFTDPVVGYRKYLDEKSFIDYFLLNELARNNDGFKKSVFFHKDRFSNGGKMKAGPIWDFDWAWKNMWGCDIFSAIDGSGWAHHINDCPTDNYSCGWYIRLFQDSSFLDQLKCTYADYRQTIFDTNYIFSYIDSMAMLVENAQERHFKKWPILGISGPAPEVNAIATTYAAELDTLKSWINLRLAWLDANMPGLCETTGINVPSQQDTWVSYYPNPTKDFIWIEAKEDATLDIIDMNGKIVSKGVRMIANSRKQIDLSTVPDGIYVLSVYNEFHTQAGRILVNH